MTRGDDYILEFLRDKNIVASPHVIALNIDFSKQYVNERIRILHAAGLVDRVQTGIYQITDLGTRYLDDDLTQNEKTELAKFRKDD